MSKRVCSRRLNDELTLGIVVLCNRGGCGSDGTARSTRSGLAVTVTNGKRERVQSRLPTPYQVHTVDCLSTILHLSIYLYNQGAYERREKCPGRQMMSHRNPIITISSSSAHSGSQAQQPRGPSTRTPRTFDPQTYIRDMPLMMMIMMMMGITKQIDSPRSPQRKLCKTLGQMAPRPFRAGSHISITP